jgi:trans-aconitate 2-methyltransferase
LSQYAFGDTEIARERLALVAATFEAPTRALLADLPYTFGRYIVDLGCGPGHTTALLHGAFPLAQITGFDESEAMIAEARVRVPDATFAAFDVTRPLLLPADIIYARLLLGHLADPRAAIATWVKSLRPGSAILVCEEPVRYRSADPYFREYEEAVTAIVAATGATLWAASTFDDDPPSCERVLDRVVEHPVSAARAAGMFWRNAVQWQDRAPGARALIDHFRAREAAGDAELVTWELRQVVFRKRPG